MESMLAEQPLSKYIEGADVPISQAMFGGDLGFVPRHYIYQGFAGSQEFQDHVETLLMYKDEQAARQKQG